MSAPSDSGQAVSEDDRIRADLAEFLAKTWGHDVSVGELTVFGSGHSGFTYLVPVTANGATVDRVLRLTAAGARLVGPADLARQGRIMSGLNARGLPAPVVLAADSTGRVAGRASLLTEKLEGTEWEVVRDRLGDRHVVEEAVRFWRDLQAVSPAEVGLDAAEAFTAQGEIDRWMVLLPRTPEEFRDPSALLAARLTESAQPSRPAGVVHGDYHFGNLMFGPDGRLVGVFDWEIASVGQPLLDLGSLAVAALRARYAPEPNPTGSVRTSVAELAELADVPPADLEWYTALSCLKYGVILAYNLQLHRSGKRVDPVYDELLATTRGLLVDGLEMVPARG